MAAAGVRAGRPPGQGQTEGLRQAIIDAARRAFVEDGYAGLTMRKIAARVGCTAGALYGHFSSRDELLWHVWSGEFEKLHTYTLGAVEQAENPVEKLRQVFLSWTRYFIARKLEFRIMFAWGGGSTGLETMKERSPVVGPNYSYHHALELLRPVLAQATHAPVDLNLAAQSLLTATFGVIAMSHSPSQFPWFDPVELTALNIDSILMGWGIRLRDT